jgi:hypothetical protein
LLKKTKNRSLTVTAQKALGFACHELQRAAGVVADRRWTFLATYPHLPIRLMCEWGIRGKLEA